MRRLGVIAAMLAVLMALALPALAHDFDGGGDCQGWTLELDGTFGAHTILINGQAQDEVETEYFIADNVASRTERTFTVTWDKDQGDVTQQHTLERDTTGCVDFTYEAACGVIDITSFINDTALDYSVALEEGTATYDLANAVFSTSGFSFDEDHNGGSVEAFLYVVGAEADFVTEAMGNDVANFWDQSAIQVTVDTDCEEPEPTTTTTQPSTTTSTTLPATTTTVADSTTTTSEPDPSTTTTTVAETTTTEATTTTTDESTTTQPPDDEPDELPFTGPSDDLGLWATAGAALLAAGVGTLGYARRKGLDR